MKMAIFKTSSIILVSILFTPTLNAYNVEEQHSEPKKKLSARETEHILSRLQWSISAPDFIPSFDIDVIDYIIEKSKTHFIPKKITQRLMEISLLHNVFPLHSQDNGKSTEGIQTDQQIKERLKRVGILHLMPERYLSGYIDFIKEEGLAFFERERSKTISALGEIGRSQSLPSDVVRFLKELIFKVSNANVRPHVISAIGNIAQYHPPGPSWLKKLARKLKHIREKNEEIIILQDRYTLFLEESLGFPGTHFELAKKKVREENMTLTEALSEIRKKMPPPFLFGFTDYIAIYEMMEIVAKKVPLPLELIQELSQPLGVIVDRDISRGFLQTLLSLAEQNGWREEAAIQLKKSIAIYETDQHESGCPRGF